MTTPTEPPRKFVELGPDVLISHPTVQPASPKDPSVILIFGWMGAQLPHLHKYTQGYDALYPGAVQILVRSREKFWWSSQAQRDASVAPAKKALKDLGIDGKTDLASTPRLLVHAFSNGGCFQFATLAKLIVDDRPGDKAQYPAIPASALILDSCPGQADRVGFVRAFSAGVRNPGLKLLTVSLLNVAFVFVFILSHLIGRPDPFSVIKDALLDPKFIPNQTPRTFIYSIPDQLVQWQVVEEYADTTTKLGIPVFREKYEKTAHVNHLKEGPERYWGVAKRAWEGRA